MIFSYEVGMSFPDKRYANEEGAIIRFLESGFDVLIIMGDIDEEEISSFESKNFRYGFFITEAVPFLVMDFNLDFNLECSFNVLKLGNFQFWLRSEFNLVTIYIIEKKGFILKAMRTVTLAKDLQNSLIIALQEQYQKYKTINEVDRQISSISEKFTVEKMLAKI